MSKSTISFEGEASEIGLKVFAKFITPAVRACAPTMPAEELEDLFIGVYAALYTEMCLQFGRDKTQTILQTILQTCLDTPDTAPEAAPAGRTLQ